MITRITDKAGVALELDHYSLSNGFARSIRVQIEFNLSKALPLGVWIPLSGSGSDLGPKVI